jgi:thiol:disulfide interchange protein DsbD
MPCVLPVLSLKALAITKKSGKERSETIKHGIAYTLGILLCFGAIAFLLISLKQAGEAVGWGYQMQSPAFVGFLIYLLFLVGLNMSGVFELPVLFGNTGGNLASESSARGSFFTGVLATLVATPCTAPFMASAVGIALTLPAWQSMLVFEMLGFGLASPFLLISIFPACLKFLPKSGAWMETFKQFMAFPIYASVIWLLWVLAMQTGADGILVAASGMLALVMTIWMKRIFGSMTMYHVTAAIFCAVIALWSLPLLSNLVKPESGHSSLQPEGTVAFSKETLEALHRDGKGVFVDATAAWCLTCQVNWRVVGSEQVRAIMKEKNITLMIADWTLKNPEISAWLSSFGYEGVPLYVYYPANGKPQVLPQLLTQDIINQTLNP